MASGTIRLIAGNGERGVPADGAVAREAPLVDPRAVAADGEGNVYILERGGHALRVVDRAGKIRTVAGTGKAGPAGDDGPALAATLRGPKHLCLDREGNVIIADTDNHVDPQVPAERRETRAYRRNRENGYRRPRRAARKKSS